jgi:hypothetical protein
MPLQDVGKVRSRAEPFAQAGIGIMTVDRTPDRAPEALVDHRCRSRDLEHVRQQRFRLNAGAMIVGGDRLQRSLGNAVAKPPRDKNTVLRAISGRLEEGQVMAETDDLPETAPSQKCSASLRIKWAATRVRIALGVAPKRRVTRACASARLSVEGLVASRVSLRSPR